MLILFPSSFGGTDGVHWFNDVWCYNPHTNSWTQLECIGYIPSPREGHAAALVGDVMYIFGGRTEEGTDLGDLAAFRISSRRWYTFQNMGPSPSPRSGHSMTTVGKQIVVLAGEPSSAPRDPVELALAYFLDTSKIRYPADNAGPPSANDRVQGHRRPSGEKGPPQMGPSVARGPMPRELMEREPRGSTDSRSRSESASRVPRLGQQPAIAAPSGALSPSPQQQPQPQLKPNGVPPARQPSRPDRAFSPPADSDRAQRFEERAMASPQLQSGLDSPSAQNQRMPTSPTFGDDHSLYGRDQQQQQQHQLQQQQLHNRRQKPETYQPTQDPSENTTARSTSRAQSRAESERPEDRIAHPDEQPEQLPKVKQIMREENEVPQDSGIGSSPALTQQYDILARELEQTKQKNAWYASELALARKSGYQTRATDSPVFDERAVDVFGEDDKPLLEALLKMRSELARVQETIDSQSRTTAVRIAEMEKQRDAAINEAVFAKARSAGSSGDNEARAGAMDADRHGDLNKRLAGSLGVQAELSRKIESLTRQTGTEKQSRQLAEETAEAAQKRLAELDASRQQYASEIESLRSELHEAQKEAREASANHADISAQHKLLSVDKQELHGRLERTLAETQNHGSILTSLRDAVTASTDKAQMLEQKLQEERQERGVIQEKFTQLQTDHEAHKTQLGHTTRRLRDAEDLADKHAREAESHRSAVLAGLGKVTEHDYDIHEAADERVTILQQQVLTANALMRQNQAAANAASEKLRRAEERIAGLEAYQEQASREGLTIRKQLQQTMKDMQALSSEKADLQIKLQSQQLETNALSVQHGALKDILGERGINASEVRRSRAVDSPSSMSRLSTSDLQRVRELEQQLEASLKSHDDMKAQFEDVSERDEKMKREYEEKLSALDNDHQAAVKYLRGTEKMLSKMKQELQRVKNENGEVKKKLEKARAGSEDGSKGANKEAPAEWEGEKEKLKMDVEKTQKDLKTSVAALEGKITTIQGQLQAAEAELHQTRSLHATSQADLSTLQVTHSQSRSDIERMHKENGLLEERARDAEAKVQLLLDQVESSVDNYRRQSRLSVGGAAPTTNGTHHVRDLSNVSITSNIPHMHSHSRNASEAGESTSSAGEPLSAGAEGGADARNSLALDTLASELDALRSHWETTNRNHRLSDRFDFERTPTANAPGGGSGDSGSLGTWRRGLDLGDEEDKSRSNSSHAAATAAAGTAGDDTHAGTAVTTDLSHGGSF